MQLGSAPLTGIGNPTQNQMATAQAYVGGGGQLLPAPAASAFLAAVQDNYPGVTFTDRMLYDLACSVAAAPASQVVSTPAPTGVQSVSTPVTVTATPQVIPVSSPAQVTVTATPQVIPVSSPAQVTMQAAPLTTTVSAGNWALIVIAAGAAYLLYKKGLL
jgi:hypothetical protein